MPGEHAEAGSEASGERSSTVRGREEMARHGARDEHGLASNASESKVCGARRRVAAAFTCFALGLIVARAWDGVPSLWWFVAIAPALATAAFARGWTLRLALAFAMFAFAGGWYTLRVHERSPTSFANVLDAVASPRGGAFTVDGYVLSDPEPAPIVRTSLSKFRPPTSAATWRFRFGVRSVVGEEESKEASGRLWVRVAGQEKPSVRAGDFVRLTGMARPIAPPLNPGQIDPRPYAAQSGYVGSLELTSSTLILDRAAEAAISAGTLDRAYAALLRLRAGALARARHVLDTAFADADDADADATTRRADAPSPRAEAKALAMGLLLGDTDDPRSAGDAGRSVYDAFTRLGLAHVLSISGFHLAVLASVTLFLVRLTGDRGWVEPALVAALVLAYAMMLPPQSPILRSAAMVVLVLLAEGFGRRYDRLTMMMWIAILLLLWRPADLWSLGYQLSVGLTSLLMWLGEAWHWRLFLPPVRSDLPRPVGPGQWAWRHLKAAWSSSLLCFGTSAPLVLFRTGLVSPLGVVATIVVTPIVVLTLWVGYVLLFAGAIVPGIATWCGGLLRFFAASAVKATAWLDALPLSSVRVPGASLAWTLAATGVMLTLFRQGRARQARWWAALAGVVMWLAVEWFVGAGVRAGVLVRLDSLAVGDGSCHVVRSGRDAMLWDCGSLGSGLDEAKLRHAMRALGVWQVPLAVVTHPDIDHFGSMPELATTLGVRTLLVNERFLAQAGEEPESAASAFLREMLSRGVRVRSVVAGDRVTLGDSELTFLSPPAGATWSKDNEHSLVAAVRVLAPDANQSSGETMTLLLTGDIQSEGLRHVAEQYPDLSADVLEAPHHGSALPESVLWVHRLRPRVVIQSTGISRAGDDRWATLREQVAWYTTCTDGAAWAKIMRDGRVRSGSVRR